MLKDLLIKNLVLMERCDIYFDDQFSAITGETGSGKTAILHSLRLLLGQKLDVSLIRSGFQKGSISATFCSIPNHIMEMLETLGIETEDSSLILFREISSDGKSKCFVNDRAVSLSLLQKISSQLIQIIDQSSYHELRQTDAPRDLLDGFGGLQKEKENLITLYTALKESKEEEKKLEERERQKERELDFCLFQEKELSSLSLKEGEDDVLFKEYSESFQSQEIVEKIEKILELLNDSSINNSSSCLALLKQSNAICAQLAGGHKALEEPSKLLKESTLLLEDAIGHLRSSISLFDIDPKRLSFLEEKLSLIEKMKKKYGSSIESWDKYKKELQDKINLFNNLEEDRLASKKKVEMIEKELILSSKILSEKRKIAALELSPKIEKELCDLNMPEAIFEIRIDKQPITQMGEDRISFWLKPNKGEESVSVRESSSGGELSRLLLAFKLSLAEKNSTPTLIFDEIDSNVGGETARMIGEKLSALSAVRQVVCITHFPQVAKQAKRHFRVQKNTIEDRTLATVETLSEQKKEEELLRMLGGKKTVQQV